MINYKETLNFDSILGSIVNTYNKKNISFCLLRNSDVSWTNGDDIDILLNYLDLDLAVSEIYTIINSISSTSIVFDKEVDFHRHLFISFYDDLALENKMLVIDFQTGIIENDILFFLAEDLLHYKKQKGSIPRLDKCMEAILILIHSIFGKRKFNRNYWKIIVDENKENSAEFFKLLQLVFRGNVVVRIIKSIKDNCQLSVLAISNTDLLPHIISKKRSRFFDRLFTRIEWILNPPGKLICFEGDVDLKIKKDLLTAINLSPYVSYELVIDLNFTIDLNKQIHTNSSVIKKFILNLKILYNSAMYYLRIRNRLSKNEVILSCNYLNDNLLLDNMLNKHKVTFINRKVIDFISLVVLFDDNNLLINSNRCFVVESNYNQRTVIQVMLSRIFKRKL